MKYVTYISDDKQTITRIMNQWIENGWDLTKKFIMIAGGGTSNWFTLFYDKELDSVCKNDLDTI